MMVPILTALAINSIKSTNSIKLSPRDYRRWCDLAQREIELKEKAIDTQFKMWEQTNRGDG